MSVKPVNINSKAKADPDSLPISGEDQVQWVGGPPGWKVEFKNGSPFRGTIFEAGNAQSGPVESTAQNKTYKYTVTVPGQPENDPTIILQR